MKLTGDDYFDGIEFRELFCSYENSVKSGHSMFMDVDDLADIIDYYYTIGDKGKARKTALAALDIYPGASHPLAFLAREALEAGNVKAAEMYASQVSDKEGIDYTFLKAEIMVSQNEIEKADQYLLSFFNAIDKEDKNDCVIDIGNLYMDYGVTDRANEWLKRSQNDRRKEFLELKGWVKTESGFYHEGIRIFNKLVDSLPFNKEYWYQLANAYYLNADFDAAIESIEYAIAIAPEDMEFTLLKANAMFELGKIEEAETYFKRYVSKLPNEYNGLYNLGICLNQQKKYEEGIRYLEKAERQSSARTPNIATLHQELALTYCQLHQTEKALEYADKLSLDDYDEAERLVLKGHICLDAKQPKEAEAMFKRAITLSDSAPRVILRIAVSLYDNGILSLCYTMLKKFTNSSLSKTTPSCHIYMALCCWDMKKYKEFRAHLKIAVRSCPQQSKEILGYLFPVDLPPKDYCKYIDNIINNPTK